MRFTTVLRFGESVISPGGGGEGEVTFGSKREAKEAVAAKGVEVLSDVPVPGGGAGAAAEENWVGKLAGTKAIIFSYSFWQPWPRGIMGVGGVAGWLVKLIATSPSPFDRTNDTFCAFPC